MREFKRVYKHKQYWGENKTKWANKPQPRNILREWRGMKTSLNKRKGGPCEQHPYSNNGTGRALSGKVKIKNGTLEEFRKEENTRKH